MVVEVLPVTTPAKIGCVVATPAVRVAA